MALCASSFSAHFNRTVGAGLLKPSPLSSQFSWSTDLHRQAKQKHYQAECVAWANFQTGSIPLKGQVKKRQCVVWASLAEREEYPSQRPPTPLLDPINFPIHMKNLSIKEVKQLADELRLDVIFNVPKTRGHLGSSLGVVELTVALHYVFNVPQGRILCDVGHQGNIVMDEKSNSTYCVYVSDVATGYGVGAFLFLLSSELLLMGVTKCMCFG